MAVAVYATDLTDLYTDNQGTWSLVTSGGGGQNAITDPETDDYIQGSSSVSRNPFSSSIRGMVNNIGTTTVTTGECVWLWVKADVAQALGSQAAGGIQCLIGNSVTDYECYYVAGSDTYAFGGWRCYPIDPDLTGDTQVGTPSGVTSVFGVRFNVPATGPAKGYPFKADAIRHGRFAEITGGTGADPEATFVGLATYQGDITRQWGQFQESNGTFLLQGGLRLGTSGTAVEFLDSNRAIFIQNTEYVPTAFNRIEVNNSSSVVTISDSTITALGTVSRGDFESVDSATITITSCTFTDMGTFIFDASTNAQQITNTVFRRCDSVTVGGASFDLCTFDSSRATEAVITADLALIDGCKFISDGTGHAIEITVAGTYSFAGNTFEGYAGTNGTTGNEAIYNTSGGLVTINVGAGGGTPTYHNDGASTTVVNNTKTLTLTDIPTGVQVTIVNSSTRAELQNTTSTGVDITYGHSGGETVDILLMSTLYDPNASSIYNLTLPNSDSSIKFNMTDDRDYDNPT